MSELSGRSMIFLRIIAYASFAIILLVLWYAALSSLTQKLSDVGANLVSVEWPPPSISPVYMKPITYLYVGSLVFMYSELELNKGRIMRLPSAWKTIFKFLGFMAAACFLYEIAYNFVLWGGLISAGAVLGNLNPDVYVNQFPHLAEPWNLVFATKLWTVFFIAGLYVFWFFNRLEDQKNLSSLLSAHEREMPA